MAKINSSNGNETKSDIFLWDIIKSDVIYFFCQKIMYTLKYFNDFQNQHFSVLWLKWTQTMETKQNQTTSIRHIKMWLHFSLVAKS